MDQYHKAHWVYHHIKMTGQSALGRFPVVLELLFAAIKDPSDPLLCCGRELLEPFPFRAAPPLCCGREPLQSFLQAPPRLPRGPPARMEAHSDSGEWHGNMVVHSLP